jgi:hypothetical protein
VHTNESASESVSGAEGLAGYTAAPHPPDYPAYHVLTDSDSAVRTAWDTDQVNGAGGVNARAWHVCLYGTARQSSADWHDAYSKAEIVITAELVRQACARFGLPVGRLAPTEVRAGGKGICGHVDVSAVYGASQGHTDPGPFFPWDEFLAAVRNDEPSPEEIAAFLRWLEEIDVEHGQAVDFVLKPGDPTSGYTLERWGSVQAFGSAVPVRASGYWEGKDIARRIQVVDWEKGLGYVMDLDGGLHPFGPDGVPPLPQLKSPYWNGGKQVPFNETRA